MKKLNGITLYVFSLIMGLSLMVSVSYAQTPSASDTAGGVLQQDINRDAVKSMEKRILTEKKEDAGEVAQDLIPESEGPKVRIDIISIEGVTIVSREKIDAIISGYEGRELSIEEIQKLAEEITAVYRKAGYVTSRAYVPPQDLTDGELLIKVVEGKLGRMEIRGNEYFKTSLLEKKIELEPQGYFDYSALQKSLVYINEHPDRQAKAILVPGEEPGTTDLILEVEDNYPFHVGFEFDNYASRYLNRYRYAITLEHNNITGHDDKVFLKAQYSDGLLMELQQMRYVLPISRSWEVGGYYLHSETDLGEEFDTLDAHGEATVIGLFTSKKVVNREGIEFRLNSGFDYKDIQNYLLGSKTSHDELRVLKGGFDLDVPDRWGRSIFTAELDLGLEDFMGSMEEKDSDASRTGAGGKFQKEVFNFFRLQPMPWTSWILWKTQAQFSNHALVASEQFQIGGPRSVRAYSPAEYSGDKGYYTAVEWSFPLYFLNKDIKVPFTEESLYDSLHMVAFYDIGFVNIKNVTAGERENRTLKGYGFGTRLNVADDLDMRVEVGLPIGDTSVDGDHAHTWVELQAKF